MWKQDVQDNMLETTIKPYIFSEEDGNLSDDNRYLNRLSVPNPTIGNSLPHLDMSENKMSGQF